ncbi:hypothetical protein HUG17_0979 [Dermatophagoides farinae]|uniref:Uncharacterized protein n=1 Tax=Dermatophagoides farinae TaxID=6954 RepID=A0A9D4SL46_DERFA|nr:hypothetical protein HUG17_0979 [Dermatophagoides farinae]
MVQHDQNKQQQPLLCLDRLIQDLEQLSHDHQTADIIFIVDNQNESTSNNNNNNNKNENNKISTEDGQNNECDTLYAHHLILRTRCQSFQNVSSSDICCRQMFGTTITHDGQTWIIRWPQIKPHALRKVLNYVYTSKIEINDDDDDDDIFDMLTIAYELGLVELIDIGEKRIATTIDVQNVCRYLDKAIEICRKIQENGPNRIIDLCMQFINQTANECVKTESFRNISKETMIHLLRSDQFSLDEADVFRCTIEWAKHQTGIHKLVEHWNEDDRKLKCLLKKLNQLVSYRLNFHWNDIDLLLLPLITTIIIQSHKSQNHHQQQIHDSIGNKRLKPRSTGNVYRLFLESKLLSNMNVKYEQTLNDWYGNIHGTNNKQRWRLIFRASEHKFSAEAFHNYCDGMAPTFVLVLSTKGYLSGGFCDIPWTSGNRGRGCYASSEKSFLFRLKTPCDEQPPIKYEVKKKIFAIGHMASKGPVFGAGADLLLADSCHLNEDSYSNLPHSYDGPDASVDTLFGSYYFTAVDYEVFTILADN